eukprot:14742205-Heterocapsa_arctica.AAC.1
MLKARQIQSHNRSKTNKARQKHSEEEDKAEHRLEEEAIDKSDTEDNSCVMNNINIYTNSIDQKDDRDRHEENQRLERADNFEERENKITKQIDTHEEVQHVESDDTKAEDFQHNKKPRTEDKQD